MKVLLLGSGGQVGTSIKLQKPKEINLISFTKKDLDITNQKDCEEKFINHKPDWVINAAAYTEVDNAEKNRNLAFSVNRDGPKFISEILKDIGGKLMHISTDFVFDGNSSQPYKVSDKKNPISIYGLSKSLGEDEIRRILFKKNNSIILRTSWIMGPFGVNFAKTMLKMHCEKDTFKVVNDQLGSPTSSISLANICWKIIQKNLNNNLNFPPIMHWRDEGITSWYEVAKEIGYIGYKLKKIPKISVLEPIKSIEYKTLAKRPLYSVLDTSDTKKILNVNAKHWKKTLLHSFKYHH